MTTPENDDLVACSCCGMMTPRKEIACTAEAVGIDACAACLEEALYYQEQLDRGEWEDRNQEEE